MPRTDDDEKYDAGGDTLGAIFGDILSSAAAGATAGVGGATKGGRGGILKDLIEFLEGERRGVLLVGVRRRRGAGNTPSIG